MHFIIYKTTNTTNGKIYIGKHKTSNLDDGYVGSGKNLKHAIAKYGIENFTKEVLFIFDNEAEMNSKEAEIVNEEFILREDTYNICIGGQGGFEYINSNGLRGCYNEKTRKKISKTLKGRPPSNATIEAIKKSHSLGKHKYDTFSGKTHTYESKQKMKKSKNVGTSNSQFGTMWITDGKENKKIKKDVDIMPDGWYKGRTMNM